MTTYLLHVTIADVLDKLTKILIQRNYEINFSHPEQKMIIAYASLDTLRMVQVNILPVNTYLEINIHSTCFCKGTSLLTNDISEEELISKELEASFTNDFNTFRLTPEDYVLSFI